MYSHVVIMASVLPPLKRMGPTQRTTVREFASVNGIMWTRIRERELSAGRS